MASPSSLLAPPELRTPHLGLPPAHSPSPRLPNRIPTRHVCSDLPVNEPRKGACARVRMSQQAVQAEVSRQPYATPLTESITAAPGRLFSILKERANRFLIIANEPPRNYIRVSIIHPGALQPCRPGPRVFEVPSATASFSERTMWGQLTSSNSQCKGHIPAGGHFS